MKKIIILAALALAACGDEKQSTESTVKAANGEIEIPRSMPERGATYYLLDAKREGNILKTLHKRVGPLDPLDPEYNGLTFTRTEINCSKRVYRVMGTHFNTLEGMKIIPDDKWTELVTGSSKSDLVNFVCSRY